MKIIKKKLEKIVGNYLSKIDKKIENEQFRCHEIARILSNKLKQRGYNIKYFDG